MRRPVPGKGPSPSGPSLLPVGPQDPSSQKSPPWTSKRAPAPMASPRALDPLSASAWKALLKSLAKLEGRTFDRTAGNATERNNADSTSKMRMLRSVGYCMKPTCVCVCVCVRVYVCVCACVCVCVCLRCMSTRRQGYKVTKQTCVRWQGYKPARPQATPNKSQID